MSTFIDDNTLFILDSYGLIYREYFAFISRPLVNSSGQNTSAIFGFFRNLLAILKNYRPRYMVAALDSKTPTFRHEIYPEYKANRAKTPEDLHAQIPYIEEILRVLGIQSVRKDGYEADDIIATLAKECENENRHCVILSADKDLQQLTNSTIRCMKPDKTKIWIELDEQRIFEDWGVPPEKLCDLLSLMGDSADNIPGVKGVGQKTAVKLLTEYGSLEEIYAHESELKGNLREKIHAGRENAFFSKKLISLCNTVPEICTETHCTKIPGTDGKSCYDETNRAATNELDFEPASEAISAASVIEQFRINKLDCKAAAEELSRLEIRAIARDFLTLSEQLTDTKRQNGENRAVHSTKKSRKSKSESTAEKEQACALKKNTGEYTGATSTEALSEFITELLSHGNAHSGTEISFDTETDSLNTLEANLVGFSLSCSEGAGIYVPILVSEPLLNGPTVQKKDAFEQLTRIFCNPDCTVVMHNAKFDIEVLATNGFKPFEYILKPDSTTPRFSAKIADTMIAAWLLEPDRSGKSSYSLEYLCETRLNLKGTEYEEIVPKNGTFADVPIEAAVKYGSEDADFTLRLWHFLRPLLEKGSLYSLFMNLEMQVLPILAEMELAGVHINPEYLNNYAVELKKQISAIEKSIYDSVGHEFNISSPKQLSTVLFDERKLPAGKKTKTGYSTDTSVLEDLALIDAVPALVLDFRAKTKLLSTYVETLPHLADPNGRIHTTFMQTGTATGRLSSKDPNLQNIPIRSEEGRKIRTAFTATPETVLISADYAQIELVVLAHLSGDKNLCDAFNSGIDVHKSTASLIYGVPMENVTPEMRRSAKTLNFGLMYGMGAFSLAKDLKITRARAKEFIDNYFKIYSGVKEFFEKSIQSAEKNGFVETLKGRRRIINGINSPNKLEKDAAIRVAKNSPIQGSAADIVKQAMIDIAEALRATPTGARLLLQVHDELILECPDDETAVSRTVELVRERMERTARLSVPLRVSIETGPSWGGFHR